MRYGFIEPITAVWLAWIAYWIIAAGDVKAARRTETPASRAAHVIPLMLCAVVFALPRWLPAALSERFLPWSLAWYWTGFALVVAGAGLSVWARRTLGRNWSGMVTLKTDHALVREGPYRRIRHPIYTGLLIAIMGSALALGEWRGLLGAVLMLGAFLRKIAIEERWMEETFGAEYTAYRARTARLIPYVY